MQETGPLAPGPAGQRRAVAGRDGLAAGGRRRAGFHLGAGGRLSDAETGRGRRRGRGRPLSSSIRPSGWPTGCGRAACSSGCPATSARTRRCPWSTRRAARRPAVDPRPRAGGPLRVRRTSASWAWRSASRTSTPTAASHLVAKGMLNGTRRASLTDPRAARSRAWSSPLTVDVDATGWRFAAGHRIRVSIAGADWPNVWPTPAPADPRPSTAGPDTPSRITLPVVPDDGPRRGAGLRPVARGPASRVRLRPARRRGP